jgi:hypothetical protein
MNSTLPFAGLSGRGKHLVWSFLAAFVLTAGVGCLNDDNKIPENCYDGILNNNEELIDCGGPICPACDPCENGQYDPLLGEQWVDCGGECEPCDPAFNGQLDPGETGIDCGGTTGVACGELCGDGLLNGLEEGVDCGGPDCDACPSCVDDLMNGEEIGIDCGGPNCDPCSTDGDCTNGLLDGDELYIDCGGSTCPECASILTWKANGQTIVADFEATAEIDASGTITIGGLSVTTQGIALALPEPPVVGWNNGSVVSLSPATAPLGVGAYQAIGGIQFTTANGGAVNVTVSYVLPEAGGIVVGTFNGTMLNDEGNSVTISQGSFTLPIQ